ncbi:hypothetical protein ACLB1O_17890 [Escherichia coli]
MMASKPSNSASLTVWAMLPNGVLRVEFLWKKPSALGAGRNSLDNINSMTMIPQPCANSGFAYRHDSGAAVFV